MALRPSSGGSDADRRDAGHRLKNLRDLRVAVVWKPIPRLGFHIQPDLLGGKRGCGLPQPTFDGAEHLQSQPGFFHVCRLPL